MAGILGYDRSSPSEAVFRINLFTAVVLIVFGLLTGGNPGTAVNGLWTVWISPAALITDYTVIGGISGGFLNAGLSMLLAVVCIRMSGAEFGGLSFGTCFIVAGFALFGKSVPNMIPIVLGSWIYGKLIGVPSSRTVFPGLLATCMGPFVTFIALNAPGPLSVRLILAVLVGIMIGMLSLICAPVTARVHNGYTLFNIGMITGFIGTLLVSIMKNFGMEFAPLSTWSLDNDQWMLILIGGLCVLFILTGMIMGGLSDYKDIFKHSGKNGTDYVRLVGLPASLINMGIMGIMAMAYILIVGGHLSGPVCAGVLTIIGFAAFGMNPYNVVFLWIGIILMSFVSIWSLNDQAILLAAVFVPCLCGITGDFGPFWGIAAGIFHVSLVRNTASNFGWLDLYNNGYAAGLVTIILLPLIEYVNKLRGKDNK